MIRCLDLFPNAPEGAVMPWAAMQLLTAHVQAKFGVNLGLPEDRYVVRICLLEDQKLPDALARERTVQYLAPQPREALEAQLTEPAPGYALRAALIDHLERPDCLEAFRYALRNDVDLLVVSYDPAALTDRQPVLRLLHTAAETGQVTVVIGPPIALE